MSPSQSWGVLSSRRAPFLPLHSWLRFRVVSPTLIPSQAMRSSFYASSFFVDRASSINDVLWRCFVTLTLKGQVSFLGSQLMLTFVQATQPTSNLHTNLWVCIVRVFTSYATHRRVRPWSRCSLSSFFLQIIIRHHFCHHYLTACAPCSWFLRTVRNHRCR